MDNQAKDSDDTMLTQGGKPYLSQDGGSDCFVIAVGNCLIHRGIEVPDLDRARDIAHCRNGATIEHQKVVDFMEAPLTEIDNPEIVLGSGGVLNIMHPIFNGHSVFVFPVEEGVGAINSWLGPNEITVTFNEIRQFLPENGSLGPHWRMSP